MNINKPLLSQYINVSSQLCAIGFKIEPQIEEDDQCSFILIPNNNGTKIHLPNIEQVEGFIRCYIIYGGLEK